MLVSGAVGRRVAREKGFSLLEAVIAAGLLLLTVTSVTAVVMSVSRAGRGAETTGHVDAVLASVCSRLAALPFCAAALPQASAIVGADAGDLVAAVFPNADVWLATDRARFVAADEGELVGGSFITRFEREGVLVTCVARFRQRLGGPWVLPGTLDGWDVSASDRPPAPVLDVQVTAVADGTTRTARVVRVAGADWVLQPAPAAPETP